MINLDCAQRSLLFRIASTLTAIYLGFVVGSPAAASLPEYAWDLRISEKELLLAHGGDQLWVDALNFDIGYNRMWHRNMPALELSNTSDAGMPDIVRFEMTIGDTRFHFSDQHFGVFAPLGVTTPDFVLTSSVADGGDRLIVDISKPDGSGLAVGEVVRFRIQLGVDPGFDFFAFPDFRTVLFNMNGNAVYGPDPNGDKANAEALSIFADGRAVGPATFVDQIIVGPAGEFFNGAVPRHSTLQPVQSFSIGASFVIPEPSSGVLALLGLLSGLAMTARRGRIRRC